MISGFPLQQGSVFCKEKHFVTLQKAGHDKYGIDCLPKSGYPVRQGTISAVTYDLVTGIWTITLAAHLAKKHNFIRFIDGSEEGVETPIFAVPSANTIQLYGKDHLANIQVGDEIQVVRYVTPSSDATGGIAVSVPVAPSQFVLDGGNQQVVEDSADPSNNHPLPVKELIRALGFARLILAPVVESGYTTLIADTGASSATKVQIFMSSGEPLYLAFGAAAAEQDQMIILPGGNGFVNLAIPPNTRLSVKKLDAPVDTSGSLLINLFG